MRDVTRAYEAFQLRCPRCDRTWRAVYLVTRWQDAAGAELAYYTRNGVAISSPWKDELCGACGTQVHVVTPRAAVPSQAERRETASA
jgi:hypothetical protein